MKKIIDNFIHVLANKSPLYLYPKNADIKNSIKERKTGDIDNPN